MKNQEPQGTIHREHKEIQGVIYEETQSRQLEKTNKNRHLRKLGLK